MSSSDVVLVIGTGTMGQGIAQVVAASGAEARMVDSDEARVKSAIGAIEKATARVVEKGKLTAEARDALLGHLKSATTIEAGADGASMVIEAVPEQMELKVTVLGRAATAAPPNAILASNTSSLSVTELGTRLGASERTLGLHFFNPVPVMELLEIVRGLKTSEATIEAGLAFAQRIKKTPIVVNDSPGFATSRLGVIVGVEAIRMLEAGVASVADIDRAMELGYRHPMGPLKLGDLVGLDVRLGILEHLHKEVGEQFRPPALLRQMVRAGRLGKKTGEGFYRWTDAGPVPITKLRGSGGGPPPARSAADERLPEAPRRRARVRRARRSLSRLLSARAARRGGDVPEHRLDVHAASGERGLAAARTVDPSTHDGLLVVDPAPLRAVPRNHRKAHARAPRAEFAAFRPGARERRNRAQRPMNAVETSMKRGLHARLHGESMRLARIV